MRKSKGDASRFSGVTLEESHRLTLGLTSYQEIKEAHLGSTKHTIDELSKTKEYAQCTFAPGPAKEVRSLSKFLKDQDKFLAAKENNIANLRKQKQQLELQQFTGTPTIDPFSQHISQRQLTKTNCSAFERLSHQKHQSAIAAESSLFTPKILNKSKSLHRKENISELLYDDAKRRQQKQSFIKEESSRKRNVSPKINQNTNTLVQRKVLAQFHELVEESEVSPLVALSVLFELFHINVNPNKDVSYCQKILSFLKSPHQSLIPSVKLQSFIRIIISGHSKEDIFTREEQQQIICSYQHYYQERLTKQKKIESPQQPSFRPKTLLSSQKMAEQHRDRVCEAVNQFVSQQQIQLNLKDGTMKIEDLFIIDDLKRKASNQKRRIQKQTKQFQQCSFKPNLRDSAITLKNLKRKPKITVTLQSRNKNKQQNEKSKQQTEEEQMRQPLKQKMPNKKQNYANSKKGSIQKVKDMDKVVLRLSVGRKNREYENKVMARGYTKDQNYVQYKKEAHKDVIQSHRKLKGYGI